jgi:Zn-dependent membrane protease YugP
MVIAMDNTDTQTRAKLVRGLMWSAPLAITLWVMLALAALAVVPHTVRHAIHTDARYAVHVLNRDLVRRPPASGLARAG